MKKKVQNSDTEDILAKLKEGDVVNTTKYGHCTVDFIDKKNLKNMPGVTVKDINGVCHFVNVKEIC